MYTVRPHFNILENASELPDFTSAKELFLDVETQNNTEDIFKTNSGKKSSGTNIHKGDRVAGIAVTCDDNPEIYYIPIRHRLGNNLPVDVVQRWMRDHVGPGGVADWVNHNIKFDAMALDFEGASFSCRLVDTLVTAKMFDSDRLGFGLKELCRDWLDLEMDQENRVKTWLKEAKTKDYSRLPIDICGEYACEDVWSNRLLHRYIMESWPAQMSNLLETEIRLTSVLFDMEKEGLRVDPTECKVELRRSLQIMLQLTSDIEEHIGCEFTGSHQNKFDILVNQFGLPILKTKVEKDPETGKKVDTGRPQFDNEALELYCVHPSVTADPNKKLVVEAMMDYSKEQTHKSLFLESFLDLHTNNYVHSLYNQIVRTGRMSSSRPNSQQQNKRSKVLIKPDEGCAIWSADYSQIEYRVIAHYINDEEVIRAYREDPTTDFHKWVADLIESDRGEGKTLNFGMAFGAGKPTVLKNLMASRTIIQNVGQIVNELIEKGEVPASRRTILLEELCRERASRVYEIYHERLPGIKRTSRLAAKTAKNRGFVFNAYGRRRHLPLKACYKAFNTIVQGSAMDIMKERMVALSPRFNKRTRDMGIRLGGNVHDEVFGMMPVEEMMNPEYHQHILGILEHPSVEFRVPIRADLGVSPNNWSEAADSKLQVTDANGCVLYGRVPREDLHCSVTS